MAGWTKQGVVGAYASRARPLRPLALGRRPRPDSPQSTGEQIDVDLTIAPGGAEAAWQEVAGGRIGMVVRRFGPAGTGARSRLASASLSRIGPRSACLPLGSTTVAQNRRARVYSVASANAPVEYFACLYSRGAPSRLPTFEGTRIAPMLRGTFVAWVGESTNAEDNVDQDIFVQDLRTEHVTEMATASGRRRIVLSRHGGLAFIACSRECYVARRQAGGRQVSILARGATIDPDSLELHGTQLSWLEGGERRVAELR